MAPKPSTQGGGFRTCLILLPTILLLIQFVYLSRRTSSVSVASLQKKNDALHVELAKLRRAEDAALRQAHASFTALEHKVDEIALAAASTNHILTGKPMRKVQPVSHDAAAPSELVVKEIHHNDTVEYRLPTTTLRSPWSLNDTRVYFEDKFAFRLSPSGRILFPRGVTSLLLEVGISNQTLILPALQEDRHAFVFSFVPLWGRMTRPNAPRYRLFHGGIDIETGFRNVKSAGHNQLTRYGVLRLSDLLDMVPASMDVEFLRITPAKGPYGADQAVLLSAGRHIPRIQRVTIEMQDLPLGHKAKKWPRAANTTITTSKLRQKGLQLLCCVCRDPRLWSVECHYGRQNHTIFAQWPSQLVQPAGQGCDQGYHRDTGLASGAAPEWSVPMCPVR